MNASLPIFRLLGVEVRLHWFWVILLAVITVGLAETLAVSVDTGTEIVLSWVVSAASALLILATVVAHELAHVVVARRSGLAPKVVVVQPLGGTFVMDSRPTTARQELRIAAAGPLLSLIFSVVLGISGLALGFVAADNVTWSLLAVCLLVPGAFNGFVALVSLVPGYPMDGARVVHAIAWARSGRADSATRSAVRVGRFAGMTVMLAGGAMAFFLDPVWAGVAMGLAGWLLIGSSRLLERRLAIEELVSGATVSDAIAGDTARVPAQLTLDLFAEAYLREGIGTAALVERSGQVVGVLGTGQIRRVPRRRWKEARAETAMAPIDTIPRVAPDAPLWPALESLERSGLDALIVAPGSPDEEVSLITRASVSRVIRARVARQMQVEGSIARLVKVIGPNARRPDGDDGTDAGAQGGDTGDDRK